jgi:hypothetical protein
MEVKKLWVMEDVFQIPFVVPVPIKAQVLYRITFIAQFRNFFYKSRAKQTTRNL